MKVFQPDEVQNRAADADEVVVVVVQIDDVRCGLPLPSVSEVLPAARVEPLPGGPPAVLGVLNLRGEPLVVVDGSACIGAGRPELRASDRFVVLDGVEPSCAIRVDAIHDLRPVPATSVVDARSLALTDTPRADLALLDDGLLIICDPAAFVTAHDAAQIRIALDARHEERPT